VTRRRVRKKSAKANALSACPETAETCGRSILLSFAEAEIRID
jgi:hypothetical protein